MQDIHDIEPPVPVGMDPFVIQMLVVLLGVLLVLGLGVLLFFYLKRRKQNRRIKNTLLLPPPLPPDQAAVNALDSLTDVMEKDPRLYYFAISAILKKFMGKVFDMRAPEMTTREVVASLSGLDLDRELATRTRDFFQFAAMVKYAGITPEAPRIRQDHDLVREFIHRTSGTPAEISANGKGGMKTGDGNMGGDRKDGAEAETGRHSVTTGVTQNSGIEAHPPYSGRRA